MSSIKRRAVDRKTKLTSRQKNIIQILTKFTASRPVTVSMISEMLGVSSRTILREIPHVEKWLMQNDFHFIRKPGVGLILDENLENQKLILELLEIESVQKDYSKEDRRKRILGELLYAQEPLKSYYFTSKFHISEGTLSTDLDEVGKWLKRYQIELIRRPGLGILLEGDESSYRQAIANVVYDSIDETQIAMLLRGERADKISNVGPVHNRVFDLIDHDMTIKVEKVLIETEKKLHIQYTDSAYIGLIVHISLAIKRLQNNEKIQMGQDKLQKAMMLPEFSVAEEICDQLKDIFHIRIPKSEVGFITMHLSSAQIWPVHSRSGRSIENINLRQLVLDIVGKVEEDLGIPLHGDDRLVDDLCNHMAPAISRLTMGLEIENSQIDGIQEEYPEVVQAVEAACEILRTEIEIAEIPESEICFLAMHFGAAMERQLEEMRQISVVVVCPTGVGTSRILEASLKKAFCCIQVKGAISAFRIDPEKLREDGIDLILSTVNLSTDFPWLCVSPILQAKDRRQIESMIVSMQSKKRQHPVGQVWGEVAGSDIQHIVYVGTELLDMIQNLRFETLHAAKDRIEIITKAGMMFADNDRMGAAIEAGLYERDQMADTYVKQFHALLLHCQTDMVEHARFGYIKLDPPVYEKGRVIFGSLVMLAPQMQNEDAVPHHLVGAIGSLLVENKTLLDQLRAGDWNGSRASIKAGLEVYYKQFLKKKIGVGDK
ncbi:MAG: PRD domain-containing protein [Clostridia bacterium]|nr:PRD domain-containing protein [Clostridia bacterium]